MRQRGFTLLELLVALAVFGLLLLGLSQTIRFGLTAWRQEVRLSDGQGDLDAVDRSLRSIIENLAPADDTVRTAITGSASEFTGRTRLRVPGPDLEPVPVEAALAVSDSRLVLRWRPYHHATLLRPPPPQETDLMDGVTSLQIAYWQPSGVWVSSWQQPDLPVLIRLRLRLRGDRRWPDIVVAPLLSSRP
ncbi:MAG: prepilin-type N-terminal cleavage/methylation domain-containing protein [Acetobacteraceae bacterium]|nr:prepilin-type N-terminal cleavage/methylation domain-containing protein [Alphaproteobacteria bacterium]MBV8576655.1 prepilin-type N-terminal cleavage/methylation domain-containing protein [Acetobacteraceae bacterium]